MQINEQTAAQLVATAAEAVSARQDDFHEVLDDLPAAIYVTDRQGTITYYNRACIELAGRTPQLGVDKWCVTWKLFSSDGTPLPHNECPMAIALREQRCVRDVQAIAERPDGRRFSFVPFPTPLFDSEGNLAGAVNLLMDVTNQRKPEYLKAQAEKCRGLAESTDNLETAEMLALMAAKYDEQATRYVARRRAVND